MLMQIYIRNLATIEEIELSFSRGGTMITGETGAGKSIFIEAIELGLGGRSRIEMIRPGKEQAEISLCFDISSLSPAIEWLDHQAIPNDNNECLIRRVLSQDGRSRNFVNGIPCTLQLIRELSEHLFHLHGQHEQQVLLKTENQRDILDRFANHLPLTKTVSELASQWQQLDQHIKERRATITNSEQQRDYLRFQLDEFSALQLREDEWHTLENEHRKLAHLETIFAHIQTTLQELTESEDNNVLLSLNKMRKALETLAAIDPKILSWVSLLDSVSIQLSDLETELQHYLEINELDPDRLHYVEQRIGQIVDLARKHKIQPTELIAYYKTIQQELSAIDSSDNELAALEKTQQELAKQYHLAANTLSLKRQQAAIQLANEITKTIRSLSLPYGECHIALEKQTNLSLLSPHGYEKIVFLIKTNPDQPLQALAKTISGGELSRLSLAVHLALANQAITPTIIFDEVDTGVGGATAEKIGKLLRTLGKTYQVFCITHLAQVAAYGHHHLFVEKRIIDQLTFTRLRLLQTSDKPHEIARMLGGEKITATTLQHATEILENV